MLPAFLVWFGMRATQRGSHTAYRVRIDDAHLEVETPYCVARTPLVHVSRVVESAEGFTLALPATAVEVPMAALGGDRRRLLDVLPAHVATDGARGGEGQRRAGAVAVAAARGPPRGGLLRGGGRDERAVGSLPQRRAHRAIRPSARPRRGLPGDRPHLAHAPLVARHLATIAAGTLALALAVPAARTTGLASTACVALFAALVQHSLGRQRQRVEATLSRRCAFTPEGMLLASDTGERVALRRRAGPERWGPWLVVVLHGELVAVLRDDDRALGRSWPSARRSACLPAMARVRKLLALGVAWVATVGVALALAR